MAMKLGIASFPSSSLSCVGLGMRLLLTYSQAFLLWKLCFYLPIGLYLTAMIWEWPGDEATISLLMVLVPKLMRSDSETLLYMQDSYDHVRRCRRHIKPLQAFMEQLLEWETQVHCKTLTNIAQLEY